MSLKQSVIDFIQKTAGEFAEDISKDTKIVSRGDVTISLKDQNIKIDGYIAIIDKSNGKDIAKIPLIINSHIDIPLIKVPWEVKGDFKKNWE